MWSVIPLAFTWLRANPIQFMRIAGVVIAVGFVIYLWVDYRSAKNEVTKLRQEITEQAAIAEAAVTRIDEFVAAQARFQADLERLNEENAQSRAQIAEMIRGLSAIELRRLADEDPIAAAHEVTRRFDALRRLFDNATSRGSAETGAADSPAASSDSN